VHILQPALAWGTIKIVAIASGQAAIFNAEKTGKEVIAGVLSVNSAISFSLH
jgi:hypothetical protein